MSSLAAARGVAQAAAAVQPGRRRHGGQSRRLAAVARGRRPKQPAEAPLASGELSPELAGKESDLMDLLPDPANPPENLLADDSYFAPASDSYQTASGSEWDWNQPAGGPWTELADYSGFGAGEPGALPPGGAQADAFFGDALKSNDFPSEMLNEISEGNSFRREQRERYGAPFRNMTSLAHATEDELLAAAEVQALQDDAVEKAMSEAIALHHHFLENATNRYAVAVRMGELIEEIEYDDWMVPPEDPAHEREALPSWCRANFLLQEEYDQLNENAAEFDRQQSEQEMAFFEEQVDEVIRRSRVFWVDDEEPARQLQQPEEAADQTLEEMLLGALPGTGEDFGDGEGPSSSELAAAELIAIGRQRGEGGPDYLHMPLEQLSGGAFAEELLLEEEALLLAGVTGGSAANSGGLGLEDDEEDEDEEAEEEEEHGGELGSSAAFGEEEEEEGGEGRHGHPRLPSHFKERKQAALEKQRQSAERLGLRPATSTRSSDPLLNALGVDDL